MLHHLDATLEALVESELAVENVDVSFAAPDETFPPQGVSPPAISFFLYDVRENYDLRTNQWDQERQDNGMITRKRPPVRVDCSYLITAWPGDVANAAEDEHRLLGLVMKVLLAHPQIPQEYLRGEFVGQVPPLRTKIIAEHQLQSLGEFWQAMGGKPKATLNYKVTISVDIAVPEDLGPEVEKKMVIRITQKQS